MTSKYQKLVITWKQVLVQLMYSSFACTLLFHELVVAEQKTDYMFTRYRKVYLDYSAPDLP